MATGEQAKAEAARKARLPRLVATESGVLRAVWPTHVTRYLFGDGRTVDVITASDGSDLRGVLVDRWGDIKGSTEIAEADARPPS